MTNDSTQTDDITSEEKGVQSTAAKTVEVSEILILVLLLNKF